MQTPYAPLSFAAIFMSQHRAESNEKLIFRFLIFELQSILLTIFKCFYLNSHIILHKKNLQEWSNLYERCAMS